MNVNNSTVAHNVSAISSNGTFTKQIALLVSREKTLIKENAELRVANQNLVNQMSVIESQL